jgi:hypothetical protein
LLDAQPDIEQGMRMMLNHFLTAATFGLLLTAVAPVHAANQTYSPARAVDSGSLLSQDYSGSISFDDASLMSADTEWLAVDNLALAVDDGADMAGVELVSASHVPEPRSWMLILAGVGLVGVMVDRSKRRHV